MLMAIEQTITGANAHYLRGLLNAYVLAVEAGKEDRAEECRLRLESALVS
jgi:hypothetical protein